MNQEKALKRAVQALMADNPAHPKNAYAYGIEKMLALGDAVSVESRDILILGNPCKGASKLNIQHRDLPELHPVFGHQVLNVAMLLCG